MVKYRRMMVTSIRRWLILTILVVLATILLLHRHESPFADIVRAIEPDARQSKFAWRDLAQRHPVEQILQLPPKPTRNIPQIQHEFPAETALQRTLRLERSAAVKQAFVHSWEGYRKNAWRHDEVGPISGRPSNGFGGWGATLVDSLDTLWIMGLKKEFEEAVYAVHKINFSQSPTEKLNVFETTIRYLGGLLSAYDLSGQKYPILLSKAIELGDMLYAAFDTPNRMPIPRWDWKNAVKGGYQAAPRTSFLAEIGSLTLEFTRLSQLTNDSRWYDAVTRVMTHLSKHQNKTRVPGLWPILVNTEPIDFTHGITFTFGGLADSVYEYLPKQHLLLGGHSHLNYESMYLSAIQAAQDHIFFRAMNPENRRLLLTGSYERRSAIHKTLKPEGQHLTCFIGGMVALASKTFQKPEHMSIARELLNGCIWAYQSMPSGVMPEVFEVAMCDEQDCAWSEQKWFEAILKQSGKGTDDNYLEAIEEARGLIASRHLPPGFTEISDKRYQLRPEAIESVFILYRITGDESLRETAWGMFEAITNVTRTQIAYAGIQDVTTKKRPQLIDTMESFWTAETLKYFYLIFCEPDVVSLDDYVFNTEAHPFLRQKP